MNSFIYQNKQKVLTDFAEKDYLNK